MSYQSDLVTWMHWAVSQCEYIEQTLPPNCEDEFMVMEDIARTLREGADEIEQLSASLEDVLDAIIDGDARRINAIAKMHAIKKYRMATGVSLRDALKWIKAHPPNKAATAMFRGCFRPRSEPGGETL